MRSDDVRDLLRQVRPVLERVPVAGDQLTAVTADVRQRGEVVELGLEDEVGMIEGMREERIGVSKGTGSRGRFNRMVD
jgi:hypothetical protein